MPGTSWHAELTPTRQILSACENISTEGSLMSTQSPPERALPDLMVRQQNWDSGAEGSAYTAGPDRPASWVNIVNITDG